MRDHSALTKRLITEGLRAPDPPVPFSSLSPELQAAVNAYDATRRNACGRRNEPPMSDANKAAIAPFSAGAVAAYLQISPRRVA